MPKTPVTGAELSRVLFRPNSVALVGASDDPNNASYRPLKFLRQSGFAGEVYPINMKRDTVQGERAWHSIEDLPETPEHAFLMVPTGAVLDTVRACGARGVAVVSVLSGGWAESGPEGIERQLQLVEVAREEGVRVLGPNSLGLVNFGNGLLATGNAFFSEGNFLTGGTFVASQSGSLIGALVSRGQAHGVGFHTVVSVGGEADLSIGEICNATLDDDEITSYMLFLETIRHAEELAKFAKGAADRGKPVVAYKLGRSDIAAELAVSHTGALVGEDDIASLFLASCGIARVDTIDGLLTSIPMLKKLPIKPRHSAPPRIGVISTTGGGAAMVVDQLGVRGINTVRPSDDTFEKLTAATGLDVVPSTIVDLTLAGTKSEVMTAALDVMLNAPEFDMLLAVAGSSSRTQPHLLVPPIIEAAKTHDRVLATFLVPQAPQALAQITEAGVPVFQQPEACADVIAAAFSRQPPQLRPFVDGEQGGDSHILDEVQSYELLSEVGIPAAPHAVLNVAEVLDGKADLAFTFSYPVVVKVISANLAHKSDIGGVVLRVKDNDELLTAVSQLVNDVAKNRPDLKVEQVLVQPMVGGIGEVLIGYRIDAQVGPIVVLAAGGTIAELTHDRSVQLAPISLEDADAMLDEVVSLRVLRGFRDHPAGDVDALKEALVSLSRLADHKEVVEAEVNPLMVHLKDEGVAAVDAVVTVTGDSEDGQ